MARPIDIVQAFKVIDRKHEYMARQETRREEQEARRLEGKKLHKLRDALAMMDEDGGLDE